MNQENINALASKKDKEKHVFKLQGMENLEDVFVQMLGRKLWKAIRRWSGNSALPRPLKVTHSSTPPKALESLEALSFLLYLQVTILASWYFPLPDLRITSSEMMPRPFSSPSFYRYGSWGQKRSRNGKLAGVGPENAQVSELSPMIPVVPCLPFPLLGICSPQTHWSPSARQLPFGNELSQLLAQSPFLSDESRTLGLCGMVWEHKDGTAYHKQPWQAKISVTVSAVSWWWELRGREVRVK